MLEKTISLRSEGANEIVEIKYKSILITAGFISNEELCSPLIEYKDIIEKEAISMMVPTYQDILDAARRD